MLSVRLICVGKLKEAFYRQACAEYEKRLGGYCKIEIVEVAEQRLPENASGAMVEAALRQEAARIQEKIPAGAALVALCVEGKELSSQAFSEWLKKAALSGVSRLCLLIGGSVGLEEGLKKSAALRLSMSQMTFPHHLARVMALEQLYRALNLAAGGKYHK